MVRQDILRHIEPEPGHLGQYSAFFVDFIAENHVETADAVGGHHDKAVADIVNLTYLARFHGLKFLNAHVQSPCLLLVSYVLMLLISSSIITDRP